MQITLTQFERIDGLMTDLLRAGSFEACADPRGYIRTSNRLLDACIDALGMAFVDGYADALDCAADVVARSLLGTIEVLDEVAA
ncbi:hypothetical protein UFOVP368_47 [uncultured Caudovirales phage]|uniref:Uncharacterized protein n=1 Tax=uncultured Caudovirales phage TaxID=2100421 RepID=A0A6J7X1J3_9CAUD|nr:hypothetical protein UFOVP368_47 [uncultured Caudovirales phage]